MVNVRMEALQRALESLEPERDLVEPTPGAAAARRRTQRTDGCPGGTPARAEPGAAHACRPISTVTASSNAPRERRRHALDDPASADDRLGDGRGAGVRVDPRGRRGHPADGRRCRARHVQPAARGVSRCEDGPAVHAAAGAAAGAGRRSRSTTARSPRTRSWASSTATACRRPSGWSSGRRSPATSSTARR